MRINCIDNYSYATIINDIYGVYYYGLCFCKFATATLLLLPPTMHNGVVIEKGKRYADDMLYC